MVAAELAPYVRQTDAAEAVASLAKALRQLGHDVTLALPRYPGLEAGGLLVARRLTPLPLPSGGEVTVLDGQLSSGVRVVLFDAPVLFERPGIYGEGEEDYPDNAKRFGLLSEAAVGAGAPARPAGSSLRHSAPARLAGGAGPAGAAPRCRGRCFRACSRFTT